MSVTYSSLLASDSIFQFLNPAPLPNGRCRKRKSAIHGSSSSTIHGLARSGSTRWAPTPQIRASSMLSTAPFPVKAHSVYFSIKTSILLKSLHFSEGIQRLVVPNLETVSFRIEENAIIYNMGHYQQLETWLTGLRSIETTTSFRKPNSHKAATASTKAFNLQRHLISGNHRNQWHQRP